MDSPEAKQKLNAELSPGGCFYPAIKQGAQVYHCTAASKPDLGALRIILGGRPVIPKVQQEPINEGNGPERIAPATELSEEIPELAESHNSDVKDLEVSMQEVVDKKVEELRRELEEEKRKAREVAGGLWKRIAEMQLDERIRKETCQELEKRERRAREETDMVKKQIAEMQSKEEIARKEMERRAREEADGLRKRIAEMQSNSKPEEDRHTPGKSSATYLKSRNVPSLQFESIPRWTVRSPSPTVCVPLDRSSPQFADRLNDALHDQDYERCVRNFQEDDRVWFIDYLDKVRHHPPLSHRPLTLAARPSDSILRVLLPESACSSSEEYAQIIRCSQPPIRFLPTFLPLIPMCSPPVASLMCIVGPSMAYRFVSNVCK